MANHRIEIRYRADEVPIDVHPLLASLVLAANVAFLSPLPGSQAVGPQWIEITTGAANVDRVDFFIDGELAGVARKAPWRIAHDFGTSLAAHEIVAKVFSNGYRIVDSATVTTAALTAGEMVTVDLVEVPLRIRAAGMVRAEDLRVRENDVEQTIREMRPERGAASFVFVIDRSLSMGDGKLAAALRAVDGELRNLRPDDAVSVIAFNHNVAKARPIARGEKVSAILGRLEPSGGTSLRDALASIPSRQRTYAIVITDGGDRNSQTSEEEALRRISGTKTIVDAIILGDGSRFLERAAANTGGTVVDADRDGIARALRELIADINSRYLLIYQSHGTPRGWRSIAVTPRRSGIAIVKSRRGYFAS